MAKFTDFSDADRIIYLKDEFVRLIEEFLIDPSKLKETLSKEQYETALAFVPSLKAPNCDCGTCLAMDKLESRIPTELQCLIEIARKRCEERAY